MNGELILCIPGPWEDRTEFVSSVAADTKGEFIFAGGILLHVGADEHVLARFMNADPQIRKAFEIAGQGKIPAKTMDAIELHRGAAILQFPKRIQEERQKIFRFCEAMKLCGGFAVKVDSVGVAYEWEHWFEIVKSSNPFDLYRALVVLVADSNFYYSCGMHHFDLPEVEMDRCVSTTEAADVMNRFNYWRIVEKPSLAPGHTFSLMKNSPPYRLSLRADKRHAVDHPYHNEKGVWNLAAVFTSMPS